MSEFVDFNEISREIPFKTLLDNLNIPYTEKNGELKGIVKDHKFIVLVLPSHNDGRPDHVSGGYGVASQRGS